MPSDLMNCNYQQNKVNENFSCGFNCYMESFAEVGVVKY